MGTGCCMPSQVVPSDVETPVEEDIDALIWKIRQKQDKIKNSITFYEQQTIELLSAAKKSLAANDEASAVQKLHVRQIEMGYIGKFQTILQSTERTLNDLRTYKNSEQTHAAMLELKKQVMKYDIDDIIQQSSDVVQAQSQVDVTLDKINEILQPREAEEVLKQMEALREEMEAGLEDDSLGTIPQVEQEQNVSNEEQLIPAQELA